MIILQRIESGVIFVGLLTLYYLLEFNLGLLVLLILTPDISMVGYLKNPKVGTILYNFGHLYALPIILLAVSILHNFNFGEAFSIIWATHIAGDRMLGFGLKFPTSFKDTHLGKL